jgi:mRNA interferase RelE/StbE
VAESNRLSFSISLSRDAVDFVEGLPAKQRRQIAERLERLMQAPMDLPSEQLRGFAPLRRLKAGEYRIIYSIEDDMIFVRLIGKRNDDEIYKALERAWKR